MAEKSNSGKKRIFADLVALHQSMVSESHEDAVTQPPVDDPEKGEPERRVATPVEASDNRYELFCDQMPMGVLLAEVVRDRYRHPESFNPIKVNMAYAQLVGLARVTILEKAFFDVLPGGRGDWQRVLTDVATKGRPASGVSYWDATDLHVRMTFFLPSRDLLAVVVEEVGDCTPVQGSVVQHETQLDSVMRMTPDLVCRFLPDGTLTYANRAYCEFFKKVREELVGHCFLDEIISDDVGFVRSRLSVLTRNHPTVTYRHRFLSEAGVRWVEWTDVALFDDEGVIREYQSSGHDVTDARADSIELERVSGHMADLLQYRAQQHGKTASEVSEKNLSESALSTEVANLKAEVERLRSRTITGALSVCGTCKRIHDDAGHWMLVPLYLESHTAARVSAEVCPYCRSKAARDLERKQRK